MQIMSKMYRATVAVVRFRLASIARGMNQSFRKLGSEILMSSCTLRAHLMLMSQELPMLKQNDDAKHGIYNFDSSYLL